MATELTSVHDFLPTHPVATGDNTGTFGNAATDMCNSCCLNVHWNVTISLSPTSLLLTALKVFFRTYSTLLIILLSNNNNNNNNTDHHGCHHVPLLSPLRWGSAEQLAPALTRRSKHCENAAAGGLSVSVTMCNIAATLVCNYHIQYRTGWKLFISLVLSTPCLSARWLHYYQQNIVVESHYQQVWPVGMTPQLGSSSVTTWAFVCWCNSLHVQISSTLTLS